MQNQPHSTLAIANAAAVGFFVGIVFCLTFQAYTKPVQVEYRIVSKVRA